MGPGPLEVWMVVGAEGKGVQTLAPRMRNQPAQPLLLLLAPLSGG
jgi:hypothetical protein